MVSLDSLCGLSYINAVLGSVYTGEINAEEMRHGRGVMQYATGEVYTGDWHFNHIEGYGVLEDADGGYEGDWSNDEHHGFGTKKWSRAGTIYRGEWFEGKIQGRIIIAQFCSFVSLFFR